MVNKGRIRFRDGERGTKPVLAVLLCVVAVTTLFHPSSGCQFPAIFNLGDSISDTGSVSATFIRLPLPYGETFFSKPSGRFSDGRLIIDFIAEKLGLPYLRAYLDAIAPDFRHGANFAAGAATIQAADANIIAAGFNPLSLDVQLRQIDQFKERTNELHDQDERLWNQSNLPGPEDFPKALYTLDMGQNDLHYGIVTMTKEQVLESIPHILDQFTSAIETLYEKGARTFWIHNIGPIGCMPLFVAKFPPGPDDADPIGCVKSFNEVAQEFNRQLRDRVDKLRTQLRGAKLVLVDIYSAKYSLISEAEKYGFVDPLGACCGTLGYCNGDICSDPSKYISWDGTHYTEAANHWVANHILDGSLSDPPVPIDKACQDLDIQISSPTHLNRQV